MYSSATASYSESGVCAANETGGDKQSALRQTKPRRAVFTPTSAARTCRSAGARLRGRDDPTNVTLLRELQRRRRDMSIASRTPKGELPWERHVNVERLIAAGPRKLRAGCLRSRSIAKQNGKAT